MGLETAPPKKVKTLFEKSPSCYWSNKTKINYLQRRIIVYSIMYYEFNESCVSDNYYEQLSKQLVTLCKADREAFESSTYYYAMYDYDGSTGFNIPYRLTEKDKNYLTNLADYILRLSKRKR